MSFTLKEVFLSLDTDQNKDALIDFHHSNTDVIVLVEEETETEQIETVKYIASFFAYDNIKQLTAEHEESGAFLAGTYFYAKNMLLIKDCSKETISTVIDDLIEEGSFKEVFLRL